MNLLRLVSINIDAFHPKTVISNKNHQMFSRKGGLSGLVTGFGKEGLRVAYGGLVDVEGRDEGGLFVVEL